MNIEARLSQQAALGNKWRPTLPKAWVLHLLPVDVHVYRTPPRVRIYCLDGPQVSLATDGHKSPIQGDCFFCFLHGILCLNNISCVGVWVCYDKRKKAKNVPVRRGRIYEI